MARIGVSLLNHCSRPGGFSGLDGEKKLRGFRRATCMVLITGFSSRSRKSAHAQSLAAGRERPGDAPADFSNGWRAAIRGLCFLRDGRAAWCRPAVSCWRPHRGICRTGLRKLFCPDRLKLRRLEQPPGFVRLRSATAEALPLSLQDKLISHPTARSRHG